MREGEVGRERERERERGGDRYMYVHVYSDAYHSSYMYRKQVLILPYSVIFHCPLFYILLCSLMTGFKDTDVSCNCAYHCVNSTSHKTC